MSQQYLKPWRGIMEVISCCTAVATSGKPCREQAEACSTLLQGVEMYVVRIQDMPGRQPKAVFNTLVYDLKLPATITESCCSLLGKVENIGLTLVDILSTFLESATTSGWMARQASPSDQDPSDRVPTDLARAIGQQLEQAGLFKHLEAIFEQIQTQLTATVPSVAVLQELAVDEDGPASSSRGSKGKQEVLTVLQYTQQAILLYTNVQTLWPITSQQRGYSPSLDTTAIALAVKFTQHVSTWLEQLPPDWREVPYEMFAVTLAQAIRAMTRCAMLRVADAEALERVGPHRMLRYAQLLQSSVYHQALCIALFYNVHAQLIYTQMRADLAAENSEAAAAAAAPAAAASSSSKGSSSTSSKKKKKKSSSSTSGSSGSSKKGGNTAAGAASSKQELSDSWGRGSELAAGLPVCEQLLLKELACSARAVLWTAAAATAHVMAPGDLPAFNIMALEMAYKQVIDSEANVLRGMPLVLRKPGDHERAEQLHQLLPGLLLHLATAVPPDHQEGVQLAVVAANGVRWALQGVIQVQHQQRVGAGLSQALWGAAAEPPPDVLPYKYMHLFLPALQDALSQVLEEAWETSSGSSGSSSRQLHGVDPQEVLTVQEAAMRLTAVVMLLGESRVPWGYPAAFNWREGPPSPDAEAATAATTTTSSSSSNPGNGGSSSSGLSQQHPWQQHAARLAALIESYARLSSCCPLPADRGNMPPAMLAGMCSVGERPAPSCLAAAAAAAGFGSREQLQLFSLLCTLLKLGGALGPAEQTDAEEIRLAAALAAASFARLYAAQASTAAAAGAAAGDASVNSSSSSDGSGSSDHPPVSALLPWLVLFGRVCLQWAVQLQWRLQGIEGLPAAAAVVQEEVEQGTVMEKLAVQNTLYVFLTVRAELQCSEEHALLVCELLSAVAAPLQDSRVQAYLLSAGLPAGSLQERLAATAAAAVAASGAGSSEVRRELVQQVRQLGMALTSLPISEVCSNPFCLVSHEAAAAGPSELNLVKGSGKACSGCRVARYESKTCQAKHWKQHKPVCKALAAAAAAAAAAKAAGASAE